MHDKKKSTSESAIKKFFSWLLSWLKGLFFGLPKKSGKSKTTTKVKSIVGESHENPISYKAERKIGSFEPQSPPKQRPVLLKPLSLVALNDELKEAILTVKTGDGANEVRRIVAKNNKTRERLNKAILQIENKLKSTKTSGVRSDRSKLFESLGKLKEELQQVEHGQNKDRAIRLYKGKVNRDLKKLQMEFERGFSKQFSQPELREGRKQINGTKVEINKFFDSIGQENVPEHLLLVKLSKLLKKAINNANEGVTLKLIARVDQAEEDNLKCRRILQEKILEKKGAQESKKAERPQTGKEANAIDDELSALGNDLRELEQELKSVQPGKGKEKVIGPFKRKIMGDLDRVEEVYLKDVSNARLDAKTKSRLTKGVQQKISDAKQKINGLYDTLETKETARKTFRNR